MIIMIRTQIGKRTEIILISDAHVLSAIARYTPSWFLDSH